MKIGIKRGSFGLFLEFLGQIVVHDIQTHPAGALFVVSETVAQIGQQIGDIIADFLIVSFEILGAEVLQSPAEVGILQEGFEDLVLEAEHVSLVHVGKEFGVGDVPFIDHDLLGEGA